MPSRSTRTIGSVNTVMKAPWYQRSLPWVDFILVGLLALGAILDALSNAAVWITPSVTYICTAVVFVAVLVVQWLLKTKGLPWKTDDDQISRIRSLGKKQLFAFVGILVLLWFPRACTQPLPSVETPPDSVAFDLLDGLTLRRAITSIVEDDKATAIFSKSCSESLLRMKVRGGQIRAKHRIDLILQLPYRLIDSKPTFSLRVTRSDERGTYEITCVS